MNNISVKILLLSGVCLFSGMAVAHSDPAMEQKAEKNVAMMQDKMTKMQALMGQIRAAKSPEEKEKLLQQHEDMMLENMKVMKDMSIMKREMMKAEMMKEGMMKDGEKPMMSADPHAMKMGADKSGKICDHAMKEGDGKSEKMCDHKQHRKMLQQHMEQRMDMMEMMMEQMLQRESVK